MSDDWYELHFPAAVTPEQVKAALLHRFGFDADAVYTGTEASLRQYCETITRGTYPPITVLAHTYPAAPRVERAYPVQLESSDSIRAGVGGRDPLELAALLAADLDAPVLLPGGVEAYGGWLLAAADGQWAQADVDDGCVQCEDCLDCYDPADPRGVCRCEATGGCAPIVRLHGLYHPIACAPDLEAVTLDPALEYTGPGPAHGRCALPGPEWTDHAEAATVWAYPFEPSAIIDTVAADGIELVLTGSWIDPAYAALGVAARRCGRTWLDLAAERVTDPATARPTWHRLDRARCWRPDQITAWAAQAEMLFTDARARPGSAPPGGA